MMNPAREMQHVAQRSSRSQIADLSGPQVFLVLWQQTFVFAELVRLRECDLSARQTNERSERIWLSAVCRER